MSPNFLKAVEIILLSEGGYVNDPKDPGGETKFGISKRSYPSLDIRNLDVAKAREIYWKDYWLPCKCEFYSYGVALCVFDTAVTSGVTRAVKFLQEAAGANSIDGVAGNRTIKVVNSVSQWALIIKYSSIREKYLQSLVNFKFYGKGWMKRVKTVKLLAVSSLSPENV